jgi:hypothetical protein
MNTTLHFIIKKMEVSVKKSQDHNTNTISKEKKTPNFLHEKIKSNCVAK